MPVFPVLQFFRWFKMALCIDNHDIDDDRICGAFVQRPSAEPTDLSGTIAIKTKK